MEWRTPRDHEERPLGIWSRGAIEESIEQEHKADAQLNKILGARRAVLTKRERGTQTSPARGEFPCSECDAVLATPGARGAHLKGKHGIGRSLHVA